MNTFNNEVVNAISLNGGFTNVLDKGLTDLNDHRRHLVRKLRRIRKSMAQHPSKADKKTQRELDEINQTLDTVNSLIRR